MTASVEDLTGAMKDVVDPELGINVVDLGLVYGVSIDDANICTLDMTLTSAACPLTDVIERREAKRMGTSPIRAKHRFHSFLQSDKTP